jgi:hypothetical protein
LSYNIKNQVTRDERSLENFDKYQNIWFKNIKKGENARKKLNNYDIKNHKINIQQELNTPDISLFERLDLELFPKKNNRELLNASVNSLLDYSGINWKQSLRNSQIDLINDEIVPLRLSIDQIND